MRKRGTAALVVYSTGFPATLRKSTSAYMAAALQTILFLWQNAPSALGRCTLRAVQTLDRA